MFKRADNLLVDDISVAIHKILDFTKECHLLIFQTTLKLFDAVIRNF